MSTKEVEAFVKEHLNPGDSSDKTEAFLLVQKWPYTYDRFAQRYQTRYPAEDLDNENTKKGIAV